MSQSIRHLTPEELLQRSHWVRKLARSLAVDDAEAEDLAQDVLLKQVERPADHLARPRDWFRWTAVVTRNLRITQLRRDQGQRFSEEQGSRQHSTELPSTIEILEMEDERQYLVGLVRKLPEPVLTVVLLRYFEDVPTAQIAEQLGIAMSTVRSRLQRGLGLLRDELERRKGSDWRNYCMLLATPSGMTIGGKASAGVIGGAKAWLAAALLTAGGGAVIWNLVEIDTGTTPSAEPVASLDPENSSLAAGIPHGPREVPGAAAGGRSAQPESPSELPLGDSAGVLVFGSTRSISGGAVGADSVVFVSESGTTEVFSARGRDSFAVTGLTAGSWTARAIARGWRSQETEFQVVAGENNELTLILTPPTRVPVRLTDSTGEAHPNGRVPVSGLDRSVKIEWLVTRDLPTTSGTRPDSLEFEFEKLSALTPEERNALRADTLGRLLVMNAPPFHVSAVVGGHVVDSYRVDAEGQTAHLQVDPGAIDALCGTLRARLLDAGSGAPIVGAHVELRRGAGDLSSKSGNEGEVVLEKVLPGSYELRWNARGYALRKRWIDVYPGEELELGDLELGPERKLSGILRNAAGRPVTSSISVLVQSELDPRGGLSSTLRATSDESGRFELTGVPAEPLLLVTAPYATRWARSSMRVDASAGDLNALEFTFERGVPVKLRASSSSSPASYRLLRGDLPVELGRWEEGLTLELRLVPGSYVLHAEDAHGELLGAAPFEVAEGASGTLELNL